MSDGDASRRDVLLSMAAASVAPHLHEADESGGDGGEMDALTAFAVLLVSDEESVRTPSDAIRAVGNLMDEEPPTAEHELVRAAAEGDRDVTADAANRIADEIIIEDER